jgi:hypothetical protein
LEQVANPLLVGNPAEDVPHQQEERELSQVGAASEHLLPQEHPGVLLSGSTDIRADFLVQLLGKAAEYSRELITSPPSNGRFTVMAMTPPPPQSLIEYPLGELPVHQAGSRNEGSCPS